MLLSVIINASSLCSCGGGYFQLKMAKVPCKGRAVMYSGLIILYNHNLTVNGLPWHNSRWVTTVCCFIKVPHWSTRSCFSPCQDTRRRQKAPQITCRWCAYVCLFLIKKQNKMQKHVQKKWMHWEIIGKTLSDMTITDPRHGWVCAEILCVTLNYPFT